MNCMKLIFLLIFLLLVSFIVREKDVFLNFFDLIDKGINRE